MSLVNVGVEDGVSLGANKIAVDALLSIVFLGEATISLGGWTARLERPLHSIGDFDSLA